MSILATYAEQIDAMHRRAVDAVSDADAEAFYERKLTALYQLRMFCEAADPVADAMATDQQTTEDGLSLGAMMVDLASGIVSDIERDCERAAQNSLPHVAFDNARAAYRQSDREYRL
ncbi:hypothetical protein EOD42_16675 [Rhodovarius crocodyli]|uniref:Uncharacterized protein n=1 Tax=Rhodovarius crocodyli TaxID=1979269 RepID=A0A437MC56_9PROT|nr:hypothetical protein [Rhodovarius crocodyli]RVT95219.1 hypothetical protein EOD42_16675 [Rhodovarius crocodyli]